MKQIMLKKIWKIFAVNSKQIMWNFENNCAVLEKKMRKIVYRFWQCVGYIKKKKTEEKKKENPLSTVAYQETCVDPWHFKS